MNNPEEKPPNEILNDELSEAEETGKMIADIGRKITRSGQSIIDFAKATRDVINNFPEGLDIEEQISIWKNINLSNRHFLTTYRETDLSMDSSTGSFGTAIASGIESLISSEDMIPILPIERQEPARIAVAYYSELSDSYLYKEEVLDLLMLWGFDKAPVGRKSALDHITVAFGAFENPLSDSNPVITSLIPMRESITTVIEELLRRCPTQQKNPNYYQKILFIGNQLSRDDVTNAAIIELAQQITHLIDGLSAAKEVNISRDDWRWRLNQATFFLNSLLHSLDQSKTRLKG